MCIRILQRRSRLFFITCTSSKLGNLDLTRTVIPPDDLGRGAEDQHIECHLRAKALYIAVRDVAVRPKAKLAAADSAALTEDAVDCLDSGLIDLNAPLKLVFHVPALKWFG
ncbi:hypothetical protein BC936DRAFT_138583 [Jimgerdemannia flammicorona]|uniref:Uncharacterized protein n=1 Tax=Jimgerdemannia flammicorona TaxID=994334 RepID=A0A433C257_9FUNG|nr:hypothetical protein BC936DRAFT_138583 [Jimgerdemannia flammicorona]